VGVGRVVCMCVCVCVCGWVGLVAGRVVVVVVEEKAEVDLDLRSCLLDCDGWRRFWLYV
jgi:hypothetical protein